MATQNYNYQKNRITRLIKNSQFDKAESELAELIHSHPQDSELHYLAGMMHGSQYNFKDSQKGFTEALKYNPDHAKSLFELGIIQMILCRFNKALTYFHKTSTLQYKRIESKSYLDKIKQIAIVKDVTLSACLIVKNEEKNLSNCLKSIESVADEIIVVDTGSVDKTIEIAQRFGAKVIHFKWNQDFAAARNFAKKPATCDWILQIDADEELFPEDQSKLREIIHQGNCTAAFLEIRNRTSGVFGENLPIIHNLIRLYRNQKNIYYVNPIHETLEISGNAIPTDIKLLHHGYNFDANILKSKRERNTKILNKRLESNPTDFFALFYLSMLHLGNQEYDLSEIYALKILDILSADDITNQHIYLMSLKNLALINVEKKNFDEARVFCEQAIEINSQYLEPQFLLGLSYFRKGNYHKSKDCFLSYLKLHDEITKRPVFNLCAQSSSAYLFQVYHLLGKIYRKEKNYSRAQQMFRETVKINPNFWIGYADLGYINLELQDYQKAAQHLEQAINLAKNNPAVNENNKMIWLDFMNAVKYYLITLKKLPLTESNKRLKFVQ